MTFYVRSDLVIGNLCPLIFLSSCAFNICVCRPMCAVKKIAVRLIPGTPRCSSTVLPTDLSPDICMTPLDTKFASVTKLFS